MKIYHFLLRDKQNSISLMLLFIKIYANLVYSKVHMLIILNFLSISTLIRTAPPRPLGTPPKEGNPAFDEWDLVLKEGNCSMVILLNEENSRIG